MKNEIKQLFELFDKDKDGLITKDELKMVLRDFGNIDKKEIQTLYDQMGVKQDGNINFKQFSKCIETYYYKTDKQSEEEELKNSFKLFDKDKSGTIDVEELKKVLTSIGEKLSDKEVDVLFREADRNKDGHIQYSEFVKLFTKDMKL